MLRDKVKQYDKKYSAGNFYKLETGQNQIRILTEPELYDDAIDGEPVGSFISYVIVRDPENGDSLAVLNLSKVVIRWLADEEDLGKFKGYPMPYDIMIFKQKSGEKTIYVSVAVDAANSPMITPQQTEALRTAKPIAELAQALAKKKAKGLTAHTLPALSPAEVVASNQLQEKKNHAELNHMFTALTKSIETATDEEKLNKAAEMVTICVSGGTLNEFEADLVKTQIVNKKAEITGVPVDDIRVEDIPF